MEEIQERHNVRISEIETQIAELQQKKIDSFDTLSSEITFYFQEKEKQREEEDKKILAEAQAILDKEEKDKENNGNGDEKRTINAK